jgi:hypothetical protein
MQKERHTPEPVSVLLWVVATVILFVFGFRLVLMAKGHAAGIILWVQVIAMMLVGLILLALGSIVDRLSRIAFYLQNQNTVTKDYTR